VFYHWFLQEMGLQAVDLVGVGVGGWIAAQMAVMCQAPFRHLVLVDAAGVRPRQGEIADIFIIPWREVIERSLYDAENCAEALRIYTAMPLQEFGGMREAGRSMSMRMCYRPYMHDPALLPTLGKIRLPTLIVWGAQDQVMPLDCGHLYQQAIPGATLRVIDHCGHWPHFEHPQALAEIIREFVAG
jgi:pimeloyl-ACP methyl ester carboxylesterase